MDVTELKQQHEAIALVARALAKATACADPQPVGPIRWQMARLLIAHLAQEDRHFYPAIEKYGDIQARETAAQFMREMGGLANSFSIYMSQWSDDRIVREWPLFCGETADMLQALQQRVERENQILYPLAARIDTAVRRRA